MRYEAVVRDLERCARSIVANCGLDWSDDCLRFYETERPVRTASMEQVRRPIYSSSIRRWRRGEETLRPLLKRSGVARWSGAGIWTYLRAHGRLVALALVGLGVCIGVIVDDPRQPSQIASPTAIESGDRFTVAPQSFPRTADGRPMTWGALFDLYGLADETLRRSLVATLDRPFSLADGRGYRSVAIGQRTVTIVLRAAPSHTEPPQRLSWLDDQGN